MKASLTDREDEAAGRIESGARIDQAGEIADRASPYLIPVSGRAGGREIHPYEHSLGDIPTISGGGKGGDC
jgi:hypothetical protein